MGSVGCCPPSRKVRPEVAETWVREVWGGVGVRRDGKGGPPVQTTLWEGLCAGCWKAGRGCAVGGGVGVKEELRALSEASRWAPPTWEGWGASGVGLGQEEPAPQEPGSGPLPAGSHRSGPRCLLPEAEAAPEVGTYHRPRIQQQLREVDPVRRGLLSPEPYSRAEGRLPPGSRG